jgi:hypothetical protein
VCDIAQGIATQGARGAQARPVALDVQGDSIGLLVLDHQLTVWSNWKSGSGWVIGSGSRNDLDLSSHSGGECLFGATGVPGYLAD